MNKHKDNSKEDCLKWIAEEASAYLSTSLSETDGIIQGMSGSLIIQNGKLIGAVTHVLINDSAKGYGIFIENMLESSS